MCHLANQCLLLEDIDVSGCEKLTNAMLDVFLETRQNFSDKICLHLTVGGKMVHHRPWPQIYQQQKQAKAKQTLSSPPP